jgi:hypothetical protein
VGSIPITRSTFFRPCPRTRATRARSVYQVRAWIYLIHPFADIYDGIWNGMHVLLLIGFAIGNLCFGIAMMRAKQFTRIVGLFFFAASALTLALFVGELGLPMPEPLASWSYPAIQPPLGRALIGAWLWRESRMA